MKPETEKSLGDWLGVDHWRTLKVRRVHESIGRNYRVTLSNISSDILACSTARTLDVAVRRALKEAIRAK